jgi:hypothetical protein
VVKDADVGQSSQKAVVSSPDFIAAWNNYDPRIELGPYLIGPLKLPTLSRLSDRLVKQFREKLEKPSP